MKISIIMPAYQEGEAIIVKLVTLLNMAADFELIVIDSSSVEQFKQVRDRLDADVHSNRLMYLAADQKGRALQMNQGARVSQGEILLFLHADTNLPANALNSIVQGLKRNWRWGRFDVRFDQTTWPFKMIAYMMNMRSRKTGIATGDQALFMSKAAFDVVGGFNEIALMEDIAMSKKLKSIGAPLCLRAQVQTSARRWQKKGVIKTIVLMWAIRLSYFLGASPERLARWYK
ncbi:MAG: TIGR04283 family arsenosugar biosynthesis glycosyltransferase [Arenicellales bacterium]